MLNDKRVIKFLYTHQLEHNASNTSSVQENVQVHFIKKKCYKQHDLNCEKNLKYLCLKLYYIIMGKVYEEVLDFFKCFLSSEFIGNYFLFIFLPFLNCLQAFIGSTEKKVVKVYLFFLNMFLILASSFPSSLSHFCSRTLLGQSSVQSLHSFASSSLLYPLLWTEFYTTTRTPLPSSYVEALTLMFGGGALGR